MQVVAAVIAFVILTRVPEDYDPNRTRPSRKWLPRSILAPGIAIGFVNVQYPVITGFLILHLKSHGNSGPVAFSAWAGMILLSRFFLGGLPDRMDAFITYFGGLVLMAAGLLVLAAAPGPAVRHHRRPRCSALDFPSPGLPSPPPFCAGLPSAERGQRSASSAPSTISSWESVPSPPDGSRTAGLRRRVLHGRPGPHRRRHGRQVRLLPVRQTIARWSCAD